ncbi:MAG: response regulator [SAR324 cluster bacterium]|nr:response regulator [SAR324 cluster bacterium]
MSTLVDSMSNAGTSVLVVDDEEIVRDTVAAIIERYTEYRVDFAEDGMDALQKFQSSKLQGHDYELVIVDLRMPRMDGTTLIKELYQFEKNMAIIVLTGHGNLEEAHALLKNYGITDFIQKPFKNPQQLIFSIENSLEKRRLRQRLIKTNEQLELRVQEKTADLKIAMEKTQIANQAKSHFINKVSHEFRTPLNGVIGFSQLLINEAKSIGLSENIQQQLNYIFSSGQKLAELVNNIMDFSKIEADQMTIREEDFTLEALVGELEEIYMSQAELKAVNFSCLLDPSAASTIRTDRKKLLQILKHLLNNAFKFTPEGREVQINIKEWKRNIVFAVIDTGIGISEDQHEKIFEMFEQADNSPTRQFEGAGVGLSISKELAKKLGGTITLDSAPGKGSNFTLTIPHNKSSSISNARADSSPNLPSFSKASTVLIIDDEPMILKLLKTLLQGFGLQVLEADNGKSGIEKAIDSTLSGSPPDLILMDIRMPKMDGIEASRQILALPECQNIPIIAMSGDSFSEQQGRAFSAGMVDFLVKPFEMKDLLTILKKHLAQEE